MRKLSFMVVAMFALCGTVKAETLTEQVNNYVPDQGMIVRGQGCDNGSSSCCCDPCGCYPFYIALSGGLSFLGDLSDSAAAPGTISNIENKAGFVMNTALGWYEGDYRFEFEYSRFGNTADTLNNAAASAGSLGADMWTLNGYYDTALTSDINGYIGAGLGIGRGATHSLAVLPGFGQTATSDVTFAYQARIGASMDLTNRAELFGGYRFAATTEIELDHIPPVAIGLGNFQDSFLYHGIEAGLRFKF